jgi:hypothetical protein
LLNSPPEGLCNGNRQNRVFVADWGIDEQQTRDVYDGLRATPLTQSVADLCRCGQYLSYAEFELTAVSEIPYLSSSLGELSW